MSRTGDDLNVPTFWQKKNKFTIWAVRSNMKKIEMFAVGHWVSFILTDLGVCYLFYSTNLRYAMRYARRIWSTLCVMSDWFPIQHWLIQKFLRNSIQTDQNFCCTEEMGWISAFAGGRTVSCLIQQMPWSWESILRSISCALKTSRIVILCNQINLINVLSMDKLLSQLSIGNWAAFLRSQS